VKDFENDIDPFNQGLPKDHFTYNARKMPVLPNMLPIHAASDREVWGNKRILSWDKKNIEMPSVPSRRIRSIKMKLKFQEDIDDWYNSTTIGTAIVCII
jgi:hypothetical protein